MLTTRHTVAVRAVTWTIIPLRAWHARALLQSNPSSGHFGMWVILAAHEQLSREIHGNRKRECSAVLRRNEHCSVFLI